MNLITDNFGRTFIAEACDNHFGSLDVARAYVDAAEAVGAQYIKFQHHIRTEEMDETAEMSDNFSEPLHVFLDRCALSLADHKALIDYCKDKQVEYLCTPFSYAAFEELYALGNRTFKIGSGEFQDYLYLKKLANFSDCQFVFSTGMCTFEEVAETVEFLRRNGIDFALMNCVSEYPPRIGDPCFRNVEKMLNEFEGVLVGHSCHSPSIGAALGAVTMGAKIIEKHVTLSGYFKGPDKDVSVSMEDFGQLIELSKDIAPESVQKTVSESEKVVRNWAYRGLCYARDICSGEVLTLDNLTSKRPALGIPSKQFEDVIGRKVSHDVARGSRVSFNHLDGVEE